MEEEFQIPVLDQLDSSQPNYVSKLEEGLTQARTMYDSQLDRMNQLAIRYTDGIISNIEGIEGVVVDELPEVSRTEKVGDEVVREHLMRTIVARTKTRGQSREAYDVIRQSQRSHEDEMRILEDNLVRTERSMEDFMVAISGLTEVIPLNETSFEYKTLHFYIPKQDEVYEAHFSMDGSFSRPTRNSDLNPSNFSDREFLEDFKKQSEGVGANAYMVTNPSELIPVEQLFIKGILEHIRLHRTHLEEAKEDDEKTPLSFLLDSIRKGIEGLRRKARR